MTGKDVATKFRMRPTKESFRPKPYAVGSVLANLQSQPHALMNRRTVSAIPNSNASAIRA